MVIFFLGSLALLAYADAKLLRQKNISVYDENMHYSPIMWAFWHAVLGVTVLPIYLLRRKRFYEKFVCVDILPQDRILTAEAPVSRPSAVSSDALALLLHWAMGMTVWVITAEIFFMFFPEFAQGIAEVTVEAVFSSVLMVFLIYRTTQRYQQEGFWGFVALRRQGASFWKITVVPIIIGMVFAGIASSILLDRSYQPDTPLSRIIGATDSIPWLLIFIGTAIVIAPLLEEITFRGYFYKVLALAKGKMFAIGLVSFLFAFLHVGQYWGDWWAIVMVATLGLGLTLLRVWTGSTIASVITHYVYNAGVTVIPMIMLVFSNPAYVEYRMKFDQLDFASKESLLKESIAADPALAEAYNDLAWTYAENDTKLDEALSLVTRALDLDAGNSAFLDTKAEVLFRLGRIEEAIAVEESIPIQDGFLKEHVEKQLKRFRAARDSGKPVN